MLSHSTLLKEGAVHKIIVLKQTANSPSVYNGADNTLYIQTGIIFFLHVYRLYWIIILKSSLVLALSTLTQSVFIICLLLYNKIMGLQKNILIWHLR